MKSNATCTNRSQHKRVETVDSSERTGPARWGTSGPGPLLFLGAAWVWRRWVKRRWWFRPPSTTGSSRTIHTSTCERVYTNAGESVGVNCPLSAVSKISKFYRANFSPINIYNSRESKYLFLVIMRSQCLSSVFGFKFKLIVMFKETYTR